MVVDFANLAAYSSLRSNGGICDAHVVEACYRHLRVGGVFYDVGANIGSISLEIAQRHNDSVRVLAFEPQPSLAQAIAMSVALNGFRHVEVFATALGSNTGTTTLFIPKHCERASLLALSERCAKITCPMTTLDDLRHLPPPDVIKMDIEGCELPVLRGGRNLIAQHQPVIVFEAYESFGRRQVCDELKQISDYHLFRLFQDGTTEPMDSPPSRPFREVLAIPAGRA